MKVLGMFIAAALAAGGAHAEAPDEAEKAAKIEALIHVEHTKDLEQAQKALEKAQERLNESAREVADLSLRVYGPMGEEAAPPTPDHPMLGISIGTEERAGEGVRVLSVSPGGPAAQAGLRARDVIVGLDGKTLKGDGRHGQMLRVLRGAPADKALSLEYLRDGKRQTVQVIPRLMPAMPEPPMPPAPPAFAFSDDPDAFQMVFAGRSSRGYGSAELLAMTPGLGRYFGTNSGLLVVRAPKDERLKLEEGDVVLDIDGRVPANAAQAFRIFQSYRGGESLKLHVMRQQKKIELPVDLPAEGAHRNAREPARHWEDVVSASPERGGVED